jgi:iron complex outermembrane recepter protein
VIYRLIDLKMQNYYYLISICLFFTETYHAQDTTKSLKADTVKMVSDVLVISQAANNTPVTFQNIGTKELKLKSVGQEPSFLLSETPSITNYSDAGSTQGYSYFRLRGIDQTRVNITLDGVPLNEPEDQGAYFSNQADIFNSVSKIQIQRGVGTSKNGVASLAGSIQLFSPNLYDSTQTYVGAGYGSFSSGRVFVEHNSGVRKRKALYVRASSIYSNGYKFNSSNFSQSAFISGGLFLSKSDWKVTAVLGNQANKLAWLGVSDSMITVNRRTNANVNEQDKFRQYLFQVKNDWRLKKHSSLQTSVYYTFLRGNYDFNLNSFVGLPSTDELYNYAFQSNLIGFFSTYTYSKKNFTASTGLHANIYNRAHIGSEKALGRLYKNIGYKNELSVFSKAEYNYRSINFFADIQYRATTFEYKGMVKMNKLAWSFINPKIGVTAKIKPTALVYYSLASMGREPTRNDLFGGNDDLLADSAGNAVIFNKAPEYVLNHELGFRSQWNKLTVNANLYYMDFKNEIVLDGKFGPNGLALTNKVDRSYRTGLEVTLRYKINKFVSLTNNSSYNYCRIIEQNQVFSPILSPPLIINQEVNFLIKGISVSFLARYQDRSFIDFANTSEVKSYATLNLRVGYTYRKFSFSGFLNNITNAKYFNNGYVDFDGTNKYFVQAPINFHLAIKYVLF